MKRVFQSICISAFLIICLGIDGFAAGKPQYGGKVTILSAGGPTVIGYYPEMGPNDAPAMWAGMEYLMNVNEDRSFSGQLAEKMVFDERELTLTFYLREGIIFHDGSEFNADVAAWNFNLLIEKGKIQYSEIIKKVSVEGEYKLVLYLSSYNNQMDFSFGYIPMLSRKAYEKHGVDWCRSNFVGTGPFEVVEWKRDTSMKWKRFDKYWQKNRPYLDEIEYRYIPDSVTATSLMMAKQADIWLSADFKEQVELQNQNFIRQSGWGGLPTIIYLNTKNKNGPLANINVRKAVEYAINRPAIAKAVGYGLVEPMYMIHPEGNWAHDPTFTPRKYDPEKAKKLLAKAGYPNGLSLDLLVFPGWGGGTTTGEAIKAFLGDVGIKVHLDVADPGRYFGSQFGMGWKDMILSLNTVDHNSLSSFQSWYGHQPKTTLASFDPPKELLELSKKSITFKSVEDQIAITRQMSRYISDEVLMIPISYGQTAVIMQPYVHTNYLKTGLARWDMVNMWKEKHK